MASAVIANGNESSWGQSLGKIMGKKLNYSNLNPSNPNPNRKQSKPKKKQFQLVDGRYTDEHVTESISDDAYSFNQTIDDNRLKGDGFNNCGYININVSVCRRSELIEWRKKLELELDQVRSLNDRIQLGQFPVRSVHGKTKKLSGHKRPLPVDLSSQRTKNYSIANGNGSDYGALMKTCKQILTKLMRNRNSWVFNKPVDAIALGLHDYHQIVKRPMDLGTVKSNLTKNLYFSPTEFASDVRLTFNNALLYNPKTDQVHSMAAQLLSQFEDMFRPIQDKLESNVNKEQLGFANDDCQGSSWNEIPTPERLKKPKTNLAGSIPAKKPERVPLPLQNHNQSSVSNRSNSNPPSIQSPVPTPSPVRAQPVKPTGSVKAAPSVKQPKPKAKDRNKRAMTMEEKQKLGVGLQSLPQEKMPPLMQIIRRRTEQLDQDGDEIELDIEALDIETLWELDRFVTNWKKLVSKTKRQALMENNYSTAPLAVADTDEALTSDRIDGAKKIKKGDGDEDVDIGDEMPESSFPPVEIEKDDGGNARDNNMNDNGNASSSSSSSGSSSSDSSSSDSDSGSHSGSDSDADEVHS